MKNKDKITVLTIFDVRDINKKGMVSLNNQKTGIKIKVFGVDHIVELNDKAKILSIDILGEKLNVETNITEDSLTYLLKEYAVNKNSLKKLLDELSDTFKYFNIIK